MAQNNPNKEKSKNDFSDHNIKSIFDWITAHKVYTVILIILVILGFNKLIKQFQRGAFKQWQSWRPRDCPR